MTNQTDPSAEILTAAINQMRACELNDVSIASNLLISAVPVMWEAIGAKETADYLRKMADRIEKEADPLNQVN